MKLKTALYFIVWMVLLLYNYPSFAQNKNDSLLNRKTDTIHSKLNEKKGVVTKKNVDTVNKEKTRIPVLPDTNISESIGAAAKKIMRADTLGSQPDTLQGATQALAGKGYSGDSLLLSKNKYINFKSNPVSLNEVPHNFDGKEFLFYILCVVLLILGLFKTFFRGYFNNLFRVFFNTSLKQTQLSDQLQQATLPSLILNIFFAITAGIYIWLLFTFYHPPRLFNGKILLPVCILSLIVLYFIKFCILKFLGWVSDVQESINNYLFAIFLVNKITGIFLVPVIILLAFINRQWLPAIINISFMIIGLLFLSRYIKGYGTIEKKIPLSPFHFIIYIAGAEIIPLFLLYKVAIDYLI